MPILRSPSDLLVTGKRNGARDDPHGALLRFFGYALEPKIGIDEIRGRTEGILWTDGRCPGLGMDHFGEVSGCYEDDYMPDLGIPAFTTGEDFVILCEGLVHFDCVMYARREMLGWISLVLLRLAEIAPRLKPGLAKLRADQLNGDEELDALLRQLNGLDPWAHGPVGHKFSEQDRERWHSAHVPGFASTYL